MNKWAEELTGIFKCNEGSFMVVIKAWNLSRWLNEVVITASWFIGQESLQLGRVSPKPLCRLMVTYLLHNQLFFPTVCLMDLQPISRQLPSKVPGWKFVSDPPTKLLPALDFLSASIIVWSLIIITNPFIHPHTLVLFSWLNSDWCATEKESWWGTEWQMNLRNRTPNLSLLITAVKPTLTWEHRQKAS